VEGIRSCPSSRVTGPRGEQADLIVQTNLSPPEHTARTHLAAVVDLHHALLHRRTRTQHMRTWQAWLGITPIRPLTLHIQATQSMMHDRAKVLLPSLGFFPSNTKPPLRTRPPRHPMWLTRQVGAPLVRAAGRGSLGLATVTACLRQTLVWVTGISPTLRIHSTIGRLRC